MYQIIDLAAKAAIIAATATSPAAHHSPAVTNHPIHPVLTASVHQQKQAISYRHVTVQTGDSLSKLAAQHGVPGGWESLYAANQDKIKNPDLIYPGWSLKVPDQAMAASQTTAYKPRHSASAGPASDQAACTPNCPWGDGDGDGMDMDHSPFHSAPAVAPVQTVSSDAEGSSTSSSQSYSPRHSSSSASSGSGSVSPTSSFEACVIARESGGNSQVMNSSGHYGLYQFSASTWQAYGGSASSFGHASASEQKRVFDNAIAQGGQSNWSPYDGCL